MSLFTAQKFDYSVMDRITRDDGIRHYVCPDTGNHLPSVTTILSETMDKTHLVEWENRIGKEKAAREKQEAANLGSLMHTHLENHMMGIPRCEKNNLIHKLANNMADVVIQQAFPEISEVWGLEVALHFPSLYAGTTDVVGIHEGVESIMDYKTTKKIKDKKKISHYFQQLTAYALAHNWRFGTNIQRGVIFMAARNLEFKKFVIEGKEFEHYADLWQSNLLRFHNI